MGLNKSSEEVAYNLKESFGEKFDAAIIVDDLTLQECEDTKILAINKYYSHQWNWTK